MHDPRPCACWPWLFTITACIAGAIPVPSAAASHRITAVVAAVRDARPAVVNIQGQKSILDSPLNGGLGTPHEVNGMGTGVVIDPRGYILTNHHVVDGVRQINVTLDGGQSYVAQLVAHDRETDLAVIRVRTPQPLQTIRLGSSEDLMTGETVIALGNAYGYEHTVTAGIISALHRNVQVNETQQYLDLIQTDASINPGNSGGPLMNIDGQMIGLNVAVRAGAQGIGFAIPVDKALEVATRLLNVERLDNHWHGITPLSVEGPLGPVTVARVERDSPAANSGLQRGDELRRIGSTDIARPLDVERAMLGRQTGERVPVTVVRDGAEVNLDIEITESPRVTRSTRVAGAAATTPRPEGAFQESTWQTFGLLLEEAPAATLRARGLPLNGGMRVVAVRPGSSAADQQVAPGDILVQIHRWWTTNEQDVRYVLNRHDALSRLGSVRFEIVRDGVRYYGEMALNPATQSTRR